MLIIFYVFSSHILCKIEVNFRVQDLLPVWKNLNRITLNLKKAVFIQPLDTVLFHFKTTVVLTS